MINIDNLCYTIGKTPIVRAVSLTIEAGDFVAIIGENGAGKTTITKLIAGLIKPTSGTVLLNQKDTKQIRAKEIARNVAYLFQNPDKQICQKTVREELCFGMEILGVDGDEQTKRLEETLALFGLDPEEAPFSLSRGQRQLLTFASVLIMKPPILILDEPTTGLDYKECMLMMGLVKQLNEQGTTVIMVSHDMEIVTDFAKKILVLNHGTVLGYDDCDVIMRDQQMLAKASVMPSQIVALSLMLGDDFAHCKTVDDLANAIERGCQ